MITLHLTSDQVDSILAVLDIESYELAHNATDDAELEAAKRIDEVIEAINDQL